MVGKEVVVELLKLAVGPVPKAVTGKCVDGMKNEESAGKGAARGWPEVDGGPVKAGLRWPGPCTEAKDVLFQKHCSVSCAPFVGGEGVVEAAGLPNVSEPLSGEMGGLLSSRWNSCSCSYP